MALRKKTISKESMFNKIMPSLSREENEEETVETLAEQALTRPAKKAAAKKTAADVMHSS